MFSYIMLGTNDLPRAITFYDPLMEMLGYTRGGRNEDVAWWGVFNGNNTTAMGIGRPFDKQDATTGNGVMVALIARSAEHIQQLHALALNQGGKDEGGPGLRPHYGEGFYSAYVRDPDGNKLAFVYYTAQS
ncbi:VOC family protein [Salmonella enterica subsp. enterica serovar Soerenga]|uniref:VOC family protein n=1 Tax=Salmonella enterica TaxID=28901 RepID=UPI0003BCFC9C|nr:VOC family protein [Salmonella enterica]EAN4734249.1 VOC family protein [Salmonella enterica subsp. enterica serovar Soerenga]EGZ3897914.1 VOC family protein [Salmonella enterica subsp. enterica serovar Pisa]EAO4728608.1 VOC family protein [Salmonella enterica subsp. enterica serovar Soerenga]EAP5785259.1 VOC family protein [Salmonella enterica subsp. enterica serovar Soerenga]EAP5922954.1 VOC family protein [Salmonella enterica]